jgi:hypothetical protein
MMATRRRPARTLTPATVTARFPSFNGRRVEAWAARSDDGVWVYERLEITGTPWVARHVPTGIDGPWHGTLPDARAATADGTALAYVELIQAHDRGEHAATREPRCGRC